MKAREPAIAASDAPSACCARPKGGLLTVPLRKEPCFPFEEMSKHSGAFYKTAHLTIYETAIYMQAIALGSAFADLRK